MIGTISTKHCSGEFGPDIYLDTPTPSGVLLSVGSNYYDSNNYWILTVEDGMEFEFDINYHHHYYDYGPILTNYYRDDMVGRRTYGAGTVATLTQT